VVKADAYGHNAVLVSKYLQELDFIESFCVATPLEGRELRENGIFKNILILGGVLKEEIEILNRYNLIPVISDFNQLEIARKLKNRKIHLKFDTGMRRLGFYLENVNKIRPLLKEFEIEGVLTHLSSADTDREYTINQIKEFKEILNLLDVRPKYIHVQNSAGVVYECNFCNVIRVGLAMYGEKPFEDYPIELKQVMSVKSKIISIKDIKTGDRVSYNGSFVAKKPMKVAIVPFGYADGLPRSLSNRWFFLVNGKEAPILGKITMDMTIVDVSEIENISIGDEVVIVGESGNKRITFGDIANIAGTISYEIMCGISKRVIRCEKC